MKSILAVDDNKTNLQLLKQVISESYNVIPILSGSRVLQYLDKQKPDLILLDLLMSEMDGRETLQRIREISKNAKIPVIFLTVDKDEQTEAECLKMGAADFISKPFVPGVMVNRIQRILELEGYRNELQEKLSEKTKQIEAAALQASLPPLALR